MGRYIRLVWNGVEEGLTVFLLTAMTLLAFAYVVVSNLYNVFYDLAGAAPFLQTPAFAIGDWLLSIAQSMTWVIALLQLMFAWLIFIGASYCVRVGAHIGISTLTRLCPPSVQRLITAVVCLIFIGYCVLILGASIQWIQLSLHNNVYAHDLGQLAIKEWQVVLVEPVGFALIILRLVEVLVEVVRGRRFTLELSDEATESLSLIAGDAEHEDEHSHRP